MKFNSDPNKQIAIMAQSAMRLATELVIAGKVEPAYMKNAARDIMKTELELVQEFLENYKEITHESRKQDIKKAFASIKTIDDLVKVWNDLTENEQVEYQKAYDSYQKKLK